MKVTINCDMGESFGIYKLGNDLELMQYVDLVNVACGFHASDPVVMQKTVINAVQQGIGIGAHPSLPDLQGFGRREMKMDPGELTASIIYQVGALKGFLDRANAKLNHIKPHGSLYGMVSRDREVAEAVCDAVLDFQVPIFGLAGSQLESVANERHIEFIAEFYADLDYDDSGDLVITREHHSPDPISTKEKIRLALNSGKVTSLQGNNVPITMDSICVHSDTPNAVEIARIVSGIVREKM